MFCDFCEKLEIQKWLPFLVGQKFFENWVTYSVELPCGSKIPSKSLYVARFSKYKHFMCFTLLKKIQKFVEIFVEIWKSWSSQILCGSKSLPNSLYLARFLRYKHFCVLQFLRKIRKFIMATILGGTKIFFENWVSYSAELSYASKFLSNSLYLARFPRYKHFCVLHF